MDIRAVLFDLDGTLLDSLDDIARSANQVLDQLGFPSHGREAYKQFIGDGVPNLFRRALPREADSVELIARCAEQFRIAYGQGWNVETRPYEGIPELLDALFSRGLALAVLSNKPDAFTRQCVNEYLGQWEFRAVFGDRQGVPRKPDPGGALEIARQLGLAPGEILYLGDTSVDMTTARRAGMFPVGAAWGFRSVDELLSTGAARVIDHPTELLDVLDDGRPASSSG